MSDPTRNITVTVCLLLIAVGVVLRVAHLDVPSRTPDERAYFIYSLQISQKGVGALRELVAHYNASQDLWFYPPPTRVGYLCLAAAAIKSNSTPEPKTVALLSCLASILTMLLVAVIGLRFFNAWITFVALLLLCVSPLELAMARRAWQDGVFGCVALGAIWLCCEAIANPKKRLWFILLWLAGTCCLLLKESGLVVFGYCWAWLLAWFWFREKSPRACAWILASGMIGLVTGLSLIAWASGGFSDVAHVFRNNMSSVVHNEYAVSYQSGHWWSYWEGFWLMSPLATLLCLIGLVVVLARRSPHDLAVSSDRRQFLLVGMIGFILILICAASIPRYLHNLRYVSPVFGVLYLMAGLGAWSLALSVGSKIKERSARKIGVLAVIGLLVFAIADYSNFHHVFVKMAVSDLANPLLREHSLYRSISPER